MKVTNKYGVPEPLVTLAKAEYYSKGASQYSVTELMSPPRVKRLREQHSEQIEQDVSDMLWQLLGSALHVVMERGVTDGWVMEERLFTTLNDVTISGQIDLQQETDDGIVLIDYKFTSAWAVMQDKVEWEQQLNVYKWLVETVKKKKVCGLQICALIRDFSRHDHRENYPDSPIAMVDVPMWDAVKTEAYIIERLEMHREARMHMDFSEPLQKCSEEERWMSDTIHAVMREGRKTAIRVFKDVEEAKECHAEETKKGKGIVYIETRAGEPKRCTGNYCGVAQWCDQYQGEINASK